jgi:hypothetical protein
MEDQINKKGVIYVFIGLIVIFLFFYRGLVLDNSDYVEQYKKLVNDGNNNSDKMKTNMKHTAEKEIFSPPLKKDEASLTQDALKSELKNKLEEIKGEIDSFYSSLKLENDTFEKKIKELKAQNDPNLLELKIKDMENPLPKLEDDYKKNLHEYIDNLINHI